MKKVLVIVALALVSFANAQKGTVLVAGDVQFDSQKQGSAKASSFEFAPKVGYQFTDHLTAGVESVIGNTSTTTVVGSTSVDSKTDNLKLGAFLRYGTLLSGPFSIYADLGAGMQSDKDAAGVKSNGFYAGVTPAISINLKKSFALNVSFGGLTYNSMKQDLTGAEALNSFNFNIGKQFALGISKNF